MVVVHRPHKETLSRAIDIFRDSMRPFLLRGLRRVSGSTAESTIRRSLSPHQADTFDQSLRQGDDVASAIDVNFFPPLVQRNWREVFSAEFRDERTIQNELWMIAEARNQVSHPGTQDLDAEYTRARLYDIADALGRINAPDQKSAVENIRSQLLGPTSATAATESASASGIGQQDTEGTQQPRSASNLRPWREVIRPNQDVAQGSYQQAEFAADLQQVHDGRADTTQYGNPVSFYNHTYITPGIRTLLVNALKRLAGKGGDPVIQTKTGFGGGKTHSLIALYHLARSADALMNFQTGSDSRVSAEIRRIAEEAGYDDDPSGLGQVAVLDGTFLSPTDDKMIQGSGDPLNTLWGEMAYQLGGQRAYNIIGEAARRGMAPGGRQLDALFEHVGPCIILIDEPVAYVRNASVAQDSIYTFFQALTQSVRRSSNVCLVVTLPQSRVEAGGEAGAEALDRLESLLGRIEAVWEPLAVNETFEVVRRRLFGGISDMSARDETCEAFSRMYSRHRIEYPQGVTEQNYLARMKACYPIHPEIFDRLYSDWSSIPEFQRTRGVLRMMATCVNRLYLNSNSSPLIMPADLPLSDDRLANEFIRLLPGEWRPVLSEADSDNSRTDNIDRESQRYGAVGGAARRIARTVFLGSAPSGSTKGIDSRQVHLGAVRPGEGEAPYNEALGRMTGDLYYLYYADGRYFFHAEENLNKVASDRANALGDGAIDAHIVRKLDEARSRRRDVILYGNNTADVPDTDSVRLIVLPPGLSLPSRSTESDSATSEALKILLHRGDASRFRRNTLLFLTAKRDEVRNLRNEVREYLAWDSIINGETRIPNLTGTRLSQARSAASHADRDVRVALVRAYRWALAPVQSDPQRAEYHFNQAQTNATDSGEIIRCAFDKFIEDEALVDAISPASLTSMLQQYFWNDQSTDEHLSVNALWDLMIRNVYMHRLRDRTVLDYCLRQGVEQGDFGYAEGYDGTNYAGLRYRESMSVSGSMVAERAPGLLVRPEASARQKEAERVDAPQPNATPPRQGTILRPDETVVSPSPDTTEPASARPRRIVARKTTGANISLDDINQLREEIIRNLTNDGGEITVEITVSASKPEGFSESIARSVRENSRQLGLEFNEEL